MASRISRMLAPNMSSSDPVERITMTSDCFRRPEAPPALARLAPASSATTCGALVRNAALRTRFAPDPAALPDVVVELVPLAVYDALLAEVAA